MVSNSARALSHGSSVAPRAVSPATCWISAPPARQRFVPPGSEISPTARRTRVGICSDCVNQVCAQSASVAPSIGTRLCHGEAVGIVGLQQHGEHALADHLRNVRALALVDAVEPVPLFPVEAQIAAHAAVGARLGDHQRHGTFALRLHQHLAVEFQRGRHQHRQRDRLAEQVGCPARIIMALENWIEHAIAQPRYAPADRRVLDLERSDEIVALAQRVIEQSRFGHGAGYHLGGRRPTWAAGSAQSRRGIEA